MFSLKLIFGAADGGAKQIIGVTEGAPRRGGDKFVMIKRCEIIKDKSDAVRLSQSRTCVFCSFVTDQMGSRRVCVLKTYLKFCSSMGRPLFPIRKENFTSSKNIKMALYLNPLLTLDVFSKNTIYFFLLLLRRILLQFIDD